MKRKDDEIQRLKVAMKDMNIDHEEALTSLKTTYNQQIIQLQEEVAAQKRSKTKYVRPPRYYGHYSLEYSIL